MCASLCWSTAERTRLPPSLPPSLRHRATESPGRTSAARARGWIRDPPRAPEGPSLPWVTLSRDVTRGCTRSVSPTAAANLRRGKWRSCSGRRSCRPRRCTRWVYAELTAAPHHIALQISDICCVWMYSQYVAVRSGKSKVKGPGCALRAFIVQWYIRW